jgi:hypothetical protein
LDKKKRSVGVDLKNQVAGRKHRGKEMKEKKNDRQ